MNSFGEKASFIWSVADLIRGPYRPNQYKDVMLPMTVLRRLDCLLAPTKDKVLEQQKKLSGGKVKNVDPILCRVTGVPFYNTSRYTFEKLKGDPNNIAANLTNYIKGFSSRAREIIEHFGFEEHIAFDDSFTDDRFPHHKLDYMLANPPFGVEWKPEADFITREHEEQGFGGRFGAGLPRINDGSLLFIMHMINKMKDPKEGGTRLGIVFNGSPLFTGAAGSGESEIRRWIIENDWLEAIVALPDQLFYSTGIYTYLWIVTSRKKPGRRGKIQLVDGTKFLKKMRKSLGNKRNEVCDDQRDETADICTDAKGNPEPDPELRDYENVPLKEDVDEYMKREVLPHVSDAWVNESKTKIGYEINLNRYFYQYTPPRPLAEIEVDLKKIEKEIADMLAEVTE